MARTDRETVKQAYLNSTQSMAAIADQFGVSSRTVERWSKEDPEGPWPALREARGLSKVVQLTPKPKESEAQPKQRRPRKPAGDIDELEIVDLAIADLSAALGSIGMEEVRSMGGLASGLCRLIELRLKLKPRTAAELAEQAIALKIRPEEFMQALREQWQLRA